jgi:hypothetical protein
LLLDFRARLGTCCLPAWPSTVYEDYTEGNLDSLRCVTVTSNEAMKRIVPWAVLLRSPLKVSLIAILLLFGTERQAMAYTDPGTGALIWQALVAGFVGLLFYTRRITTWFKNKRGPKD